MDIRRQFRIEDRLGNAVTIAQINKDQSPVVPASVHPASQSHLFPDIGGA
jgi:hypothetical protein